MALTDTGKGLHLLQLKRKMTGQTGATEGVTTARARIHGGSAFLHSTEKRRLGDAGDWPEEKSRETGVLMAIDTRIGGWKKLRAMQG